MHTGRIQVEPKNSFTQLVPRFDVKIEYFLPPGNEGGGSASGGVCIRGGSASRGYASKEGWAETPPPTIQILWDTVNEWVVRILLECILVSEYF